MVIYCYFSFWHLKKGIHSFIHSLLRWPTREEVKRQFPKSFKKYPDTSVITDATEFFIEKPTSPCAQRAAWSDYKHHNTLKLLVGIAPCGAFTFILKLWSGSTSDWKIVQESGLIDLPEKGDHLMADRGFNIRDLLTRRGVKLNIPPFSKGRSVANFIYHTSKKAKEELSLLTPVPSQTQATTLFTFLAADVHYYLLHLFVILPLF